MIPPKRNQKFCHASLCSDAFPRKPGLLPWRELLAKLVAKIKDKTDLVHWGGFFNCGRPEHHETLAIGMDIKVRKI